MVKKGLEFWACKDIRRRSVDLLVFSHPDMVAQSVVFVAHKEGEQIAHPTLTLTFEEAEALMSELWVAGVRPSGVGSSGELAATKAHLDDMRKLVLSGEYQISREVK